MAVVTASTGQPIGRGSLLTPERQELFLQLMLAGCTVKTSAQNIGVAHQTVSHWLRTGKLVDGKDRSGLSEYEKKCSDFLTSVRENEGACKAALIINVQKHVTKDHCEHCGRKGDPRLGLKLLGQRWSDEYGPQAKLSVEMSGPNGKPIQVVVIDPRDFLRDKLIEQGITIDAEVLAEAEITHKRNGKALEHEP